MKHLCLYYFFKWKYFILYYTSTNRIVTTHRINSFWYFDVNLVRPDFEINSYKMSAFSICEHIDSKNLQTPRCLTELIGRNMCLSHWFLAYLPTNTHMVQFCSILHCNVVAPKLNIGKYAFKVSNTRLSSLNLQAQASFLSASLQFVPFLLFRHVLKETRQKIES